MGWPGQCFPSVIQPAVRFILTRAIHIRRRVHQKAYHQECHRPKITEAMIDEPKWYCQKTYCQRKGKEEAEVVKFRAAQKEKSEEEKVLLEEKREKRRLRLEAMARRSHKAGGAKKNRLKGLKAKFNARRRWCKVRPTLCSDDAGRTICTRKMRKNEKKDMAVDLDLQELRFVIVSRWIKTQYHFYIFFIYLYLY